MLKNYLELIRWDKPIGTLLLLWPTLWALFVAGSGHPPLIIVLVFILEVFLTRSAGDVINDYIDVEVDKRVKRTRNRPLARGAISQQAALYVFLGLSVMALALAVIFLKRTTLFWSIPALALLVSYPFMKRFFCLPQAYLGIAYSFGILMAFIQVLGKLPLVAWLLFMANMFWVLGYDTIYAMLDEEDDRKIGIKTAVLTLGRQVIPFVLVCYAFFVLFLSLVGLKLSFNFIYWLSLLIVAVLLFYQIWVITRTREYYLQMFKLNSWVGLVVFAGIIISNPTMVYTSYL